MERINMQLFGSFSLTCGEKVLGEKQIRSNKLTRLLVYILMNRNSVLSHQRLIEIFWEDEFRNPEGALKNAVYRLRNILKVLGTENYICTLRMRINGIRRSRWRVTMKGLSPWRDS